MVEKSERASRKSRSGPRAPDGKAPLQVLIDEQIIEDTKIMAIRKKTSASRVIESLLAGWLSGKIKIGE